MRCPHCGGEVQGVLLKAVDTKAEPSESSPEQHKWERIALTMLEGSVHAREVDLDPSLYDDLMYVDVLCHNMGGALMSRQLVASVILAWRRRKPGLPATQPR